MYSKAGICFVCYAIQITLRFHQTLKCVECMHPAVGVGLHRLQRTGAGERLLSRSEALPPLTVLSLNSFSSRHALILKSISRPLFFYFDLYPNWLNLQQKNMYIYFGHNFVETWKLEIGEL